MASLLEIIGINTINVVLFMIVLTIIVYGYFMYSYQYWSKKKFPYLQPSFPRGNKNSLSTNSIGINLSSMDYYSPIKSRGWKFAGIYTIARPVLVIIDPEYIKDILIKDFDHFIDRGFYYNEKDDPISAHLFALNASKWKDMRIKLTPTFTSGKIKTMFPMILEASNYMIEAITKCVDERQDIDIREFLARFTTDVIGTCAFGINCNSFKNPDAEFREMGRNIFKVDNIFHKLKLIVISNAPELALKLGIRGSRKDVSAFFSSMLDKTIKYRQENNIMRSDFLQLLIELMIKTKDTDKPFTFNELLSEVFLFFLAGFDTSSSTMNFALYELARQPGIQEKLRNEIYSVLEVEGGKLTYESITKMQYLQQVIDETLRIYPSVPILERKCVKQYTMRDTDLVLDKGTHILIPIINIHRDPDYYLDPLKFDPSRFNTENKKNRNSILHIPFGDGPRNCIGLRFGLLQSKIGLVQILRKFKVSISPSTKMPLHLDRQVFLLKSVETLYLSAGEIE